MEKAKLTIKQRLKIYEETLKLISINGKYEGYYVCNVLFQFWRNKLNYILSFDERVEIEFPEFYKQKPLNASPTGAWWNNTERGTLKRIKALKEAISLTKEIIIIDTKKKSK